MSRSQPTTLSELLEQRDEDLVALIEQAMRDAAGATADPEHGNVEAARHMLVAVRVELDEMRGLLP